MRPADFVRRSATLLALGVVFAASGCVPPGPPPPLAPRALLSSVMEIPSARRVQAKGTIQVSSPEGTHQGTIMLYYQDPDSLKAVVQAGLGTTVAEIAFTGPQGIVYAPQQRQAFTLDAGSAIALGTAVVHPFFLTRLMHPVAAEDMADSLAAMAEAGGYLLRGRSPEGVRTWTISSRTRELISEEFVSADQTLQWRRSFRVVRDQRAPNSLTVRLDGTTTMVNLTWIDVSPRWAHPPFHVRLPENVVAEPLKPAP